MVMAKELPEDLVIKILLLLPFVFLLRFKSVCKHWYALITNQNFIAKHVLHNKNCNTQLLLKTRDKANHDYGVSTISHETLQVSLTPLPPPYFGVNKEFHIVVVGSCNGLVCLHDCLALHDVIWNPATKETKFVSKSNLPRIVPAGYRTRIEGMGFGFDAKTNDYKIINFITISDPHLYFCSPSENGVIFHIEVYSLRANTWRKVDGPLCFLSIHHINPGIYINGMASWVAYGNGWEESFVLSFDMSDELFLKTPFPDTYSDGADKIFMLNELIAIPFIDEQGFKLSYDIWSLLKVGIKDSWTSLFTIGPFIQINDSLGFPLGFPFPLGFWKNYTIFIVNGQLVLYDPSTKQITNLQIHHHVDKEPIQLVTYMESLVSLEGSNEFEEQDNC